MHNWDCCFERFLETINPITFPVMGPYHRVQVHKWACCDDSKQSAYCVSKCYLLNIRHSILASLHYVAFLLEGICLFIGFLHLVINTDTLYCIILSYEI